jgi:transcriptional regulator with XRE-family HTH domain
VPDSPSIEDVCSRVAEILREARTSQNLSLTRLAEKAALSRQAVSYIEQGRRIPALNTLLRIAGVLQLDLGEVIHRASKAA